MATKLIVDEHPDLDVLESYAFDRLPEEDTEAFEEHLLVCESCQKALAETDEYIRLMKVATAAYLGDGKRRRVSYWIGRLGDWFQEAIADRNLVWNAAAAAILVCLSMTALMSSRAPALTSEFQAQNVKLYAYRGVETVASVRAGRALSLDLDLSGVPSATECRIEVVDASGASVWSGHAPARIEKGLHAGTYWVRLYTASGDLVREFGITAA